MSSHSRPSPQAYMSLVYFLLAFLLPFSFSQCATCSALANGFCPSGGGSTTGSQCTSCQVTTISGCQTCGGGSSCYSSLAACNAACGPASTTTTSSTTSPAAGTYLINKFYSQDTTCSRMETMWLISQVSSCNPSATCSVTGSGTSQSGTTASCATQLNIPSGWSLLQMWSSANCVGTTFGMVAAPRDTCSGYWGGQTFQLNCASSTMLQCATGATSCTSCTTTSGFKDGTCVNAAITAGVQSYKWTCPFAIACFHETTRITYRGVPYSLEDLENRRQEECKIPHVVFSDGVSISTSCSSERLRLTLDHLVFTPKGLVAASTVSVGDILFGDLGETKPCHVTSVEHETGQRYFGLNCHESSVLADGYKTSTFGQYHSIPATWMKLMSSVGGIDRASRWGDNIADLLNKMKIL